MHRPPGSLFAAIGGAGLYQACHPWMPPDARSVIARLAPRPRPRRRDDPRAAQPLSRQGARQLRSARRPPHHHRHRPALGLRPQHRRDPVQGRGADPDRAVLVRPDRATSAPTTSSNIPIPTFSSAGGLPSCRSRSSCATTWPARPAPRSGRCTKQGEREMYGHRFPDGLRENQKLPETIITPTTKAGDGEHDEPVTAAEIVERGLMAAAQWAVLTGDSAEAVRARPRDRRIARADSGRHQIRVRRRHGRADIILADEIHTPDSSRYWFAETYPRAFRRRRAARRLRQGCAAPLGGGALRPLQGRRSRRSRPR